MARAKTHVHIIASVTAVHGGTTKVSCRGTTVSRPDGHVSAGVSAHQKIISWTPCHVSDV